MQRHPHARLLGHRQHRLDEIGVVVPHLLGRVDGVSPLPNTGIASCGRGSWAGICATRRRSSCLDHRHVELGAAGAAAAGRQRSVRHTEFGMKWKPRIGMPARPMLRSVVR